ncbi:hypothetical protein PVAP13_9NG086400 [Panicum virgatum]|uniref:Uncharacterized protein n=1 Tax=Panicum virgatum TaxID=38727 RepID=A0A8T0MDA4_PANVG|nr:hypothetical protein PVAP13_9NG086400 [Panicum virgatum]
MWPAGATSASRRSLLPTPPPPPPDGAPLLPGRWRCLRLTPPLLLMALPPPSSWSVPDNVPPVADPGTGAAHRPLLASPCVFPHSWRRSPVPNAAQSSHRHSASPICPPVSGDPPPACLPIR